MFSMFREYVGGDDYKVDKGNGGNVKEGNARDLSSNGTAGSGQDDGVADVQDCGQPPQVVPIVGPGWRRF